MRKLYRLCLRFLFAATLFSFCYISKRIFASKQSIASLSHEREVLSIENVNKDKSGVDHHEKENIVNNDRLLYEKENIKPAHNTLKNGENKILKSTHHFDVKPDIRDSKNGLNSFMQKEVHDGRWNSQSKSLKLPPFVSESPDDGPGEHGAPVKFELNSEEEKESKRLFEPHNFNQYVSDRISIHRRLDDTRSQGCKDMTYPQNLSMASVIICFFNEAWSVLLRSVHSILDRTPPELLKEIILVDDFSSMDHLKGPLDQYMGGLHKVKIVRTSKREGLIRARLLGYDAATGAVLVFLDSHIECFPGWLEPMLARIAEDPKAVVFPIIPTIDKNTFSTANSMGSAVGTFRWDGLTFTWTVLSPKEAKRRTKDTDLIRSPTMPGGLFAVDTQWFTTLGTYDNQMYYWGGENIELSFKAWMCNGSVELIPCSQVGHIFRSITKIKWHEHGVTAKNSIRVAEVWMDEYKELFYDLSYSKSTYDFGDVSERKRLRESLHCHNFKWYLDNVLEFTPPTIIARGEIRSRSVPHCVDSMGYKNTPELFRCHGTGLNQRWVVTQDNFLMQGLHKKLCYEGGDILTYGCSDQNYIWWLDYEKGAVQHSASRLCLERKVPNKLTMAKCDDSKNQRWVLPEKKTR